MKRYIRIFYFSPTGSCKKIAEALAKALENDMVMEIDLTFPTARNTCSIPLNCSCLIIVLPVYAQDLPDCMRVLLSRLKGYATPAIIISVYGNVHSGRALYRAAKLMTGNGFKILAGVICPASHSYNNKSLSIAPGYPDGEAITQITRFVEVSLDQLESDSCPFINPSVLRAQINILAYLPQRLLAHLSVKKPDRNRSLCIQCNSCLNACPMSAIDLSLEIDNKLCIRCGACVKTCNRKAREIVFTSPLPYLYLRNHGKKKQDLRYYHAIP